MHFHWDFCQPVTYRVTRKWAIAAAESGFASCHLSFWPWSGAGRAGKSKAFGIITQKRALLKSALLSYKKHLDLLDNKIANEFLGCLVGSDELWLLLAPARSRCEIRNWLWSVLRGTAHTQQLQPMEEATHLLRIPWWCISSALYLCSKLPLAQPFITQVRKGKKPLDVTLCGWATYNIIVTKSKTCRCWHAGAGSSL